MVCLYFKCGLDSKILFLTLLFSLDNDNLFNHFEKIIKQNWPFTTYFQNQLLTSMLFPVKVSRNTQNP